MKLFLRVGVMHAGKLIDDRYLQPSYRRLLPPEWLDYTLL